MTITVITGKILQDLGPGAVLALGLVCRTKTMPSTILLACLVGLSQQRDHDPCRSR